MASSVYAPGRFVIVDQKRQKERLDFWQELFQKYDVKGDNDAAFPVEMIPFVAERKSGRARKAEATFKTRRANGVGKKQILAHKRDKLKSVGYVQLGTTGILNQSSRKAGGKVNTNRNVNSDSSKVKVAQEQDLPSTVILKTETNIGINRKLKNVDNVKLGTIGILNLQSSRKAGGKENTNRNFSSNLSKVKVAQEQDLRSTAILKTETNIGMNRKSKRICKRRTFILYQVAVVPRKRRTRTIQQKKIKPDPDNLNTQRLVVNIFSKEFNLLLATKYKHCLSKVVSSKRDLEECCKKLRMDLNTSAGSAKDISRNRSQSKKGTSGTNLTATCCKSTRRPEINKTICNINTIDLDSKELKDTKTSIALCKELELPRCDICIKSELHEIESTNIEVSQDDTSLSQSCKKENDVKCEHQQIESEFDCEHSSLWDSSSRSLTTNVKLQASHEDLDQKLKYEVVDVDLSRKCIRTKKLEDSHEDLARKLKCEVEDVDSSKKRTRSKTTKLKLQASHEDLEQKLKYEVVDVALSRKCARGRKLEASHEDLARKLKCEVEDVDSSIKRTRSKTTKLKLQASHEDLEQKLKYEVVDVALSRKCARGRKLEASHEDLARKLKCEVEDVDSSIKRTRSKTTKLKLQASHEDLEQKLKYEVVDVDLSRKCARGRKLEASHEDLARKLKCQVEDVDSSIKRTRSKTTKLKLQASHEDLEQKALHEDLARKLKCQVEDVDSSRKRSRSKTLPSTLNLEASQDYLRPNLKCELNDVGPARKCTQGKRAKKTSVTPAPLVEDVPQNKRESLRRQVCKNRCRLCVNCALETTPKIKRKPGLQTVTSRKICANNNTSDAQIILEKREMHNSTVPAVNAKVKSANGLRKTQSLNVFSPDTSTNARWCLRNRTVFESNEINEQIEAKLLIEEKLKSDLGNMVFQRFYYLNLPDGDKALREFWNEEVKRELQRLSKVVSFKKLSLYMKWALADRLSQSLLAV